MTELPVSEPRIDFCTSHKPPGDITIFCFVNRDGQHISPRKCQCCDFSPLAGDRDMKKFPEIKPTPDGKWRQRDDGKFRFESFVKTMPVRDYKRLMLERHGKENPNCPIEYPHSPISGEGVAQ